MKSKERFQVLYTTLEEDPEFRHLAPISKLTFFIIKFSPFNTGANIFPLYWEILERHSGLTREQLEAGILDLWRTGFVACQYPIFWIVNGLRFNPYSNPDNDNQLIDIYKTLANLPRQTIIADFCRYYGIDPPLELLFDPGEGLDLRVPEIILEGGYQSGLSWEYIGPMQGPTGGPIRGPLSDRALLRIKDKGKKIKDERTKRSLSPEVFIEIISDLNDRLTKAAQDAGRDKAPRGYRWQTKATQRDIRARIIDDGLSLADFQRVHMIKVKEWFGSDMEKYLTPATLYGQAKFEKYLNQEEPKDDGDVLDEADRIREDIATSTK